VRDMKPMTPEREADLRKCAPGWNLILHHVLTEALDGLMFERARAERAEKELAEALPAGTLYRPMSPERLARLRHQWSRINAPELNEALDAYEYVVSDPHTARMASTEAKHRAGTLLSWEEAKVRILAPTSREIEALIVEGLIVQAEALLDVSQRPDVAEWIAKARAALAARP
jgi:hypothetical protein